MKLGIFAKTYKRNRVEEVFSAVAASGLSCVQFNMACAGMASMLESPVPSAASNDISSAAARHSIEISAVSGTFNMAHPDASVRADGLCKLAHLIEWAASVRVPVITLCSGSRDPQDMWCSHPDNHTADAVGSAVTRIKVGMRVVVDPNLPCNECSSCLAGKTHLCYSLRGLGSHANGLLAQVALVPARLCVEVPANVPSVVAALAEPLACVIHVLDRSQLQAGENVVVIGARPIGLMAAMVARLNGAASVIVRETNEARLSRAEALDLKPSTPPRQPRKRLTSHLNALAPRPLSSLRLPQQRAEEESLWWVSLHPKPKSHLDHMISSVVSFLSLVPLQIPSPRLVL